MILLFTICTYLTKGRTAASFVVPTTESAVLDPATADRWDIFWLHWGISSVNIFVTGSCVKLLYYPRCLENKVVVLSKPRELVLLCHQAIRLLVCFSGEPEIEEILDGSPALASHRSAHFFGLFLVSTRVSSRYRYWMTRNTLFYSSWIATALSNISSLHRKFCNDFDTHCRMFAYILLRNKRLLFPKWRRSQLVPFSAIPRSWTWKGANLQTLKIHRKLTKIATTRICFTLVITRKRKFILAKKFGGLEAL